MGRQKRYYDPGANPQPVSAVKRAAAAATMAAMAVAGGFGENSIAFGGARNHGKTARARRTTADAERLRKANAKRDRRAQRRRERAEGE